MEDISGLLWYDGGILVSSFSFPKFSPVNRYMLTKYACLYRKKTCLAGSVSPRCSCIPSKIPSPNSILGLQFIRVIEFLLPSLCRQDWCLSLLLNYVEFPLYSPQYMYSIIDSKVSEHKCHNVYKYNNIDHSWLGIM